MSIDVALIDKTQDAIFDYVLAGRETPATAIPSVSPLLAKLTTLDAATTEQALGNMGVHLREFAQVIDSTHPDLADFQSGALLESNSFGRRLLQTLDAYAHAMKQGWDELLPYYRKIARQGVPSHFVNIRSPRRNQQFVRLVADSKVRDEIRATKQVRPIQLYPFFKKGEQAWHIQPNNFDLFTPGSKAYEQQIAQAKKQAARYKELGCDSMQKTVMDSIEQFMKTFEKQNYHGFYRITMTNAAIILAKMHGYTVASPSRTNDARMIRVPDGFLQYFKFDEGGETAEAEAERRLIEELERMVAAVAAKEAKKVEKADKKSAAKVCGYSSMSSRSLVYAPSIYPLPLFLNAVYGVKESPQTKRYKYKDGEVGVWDMIQRLESFPDFNGKPMFDHFLVLVPSPQPAFWDAKPGVEKVLETGKQTYSVVCGDRAETFDNPINAKICLDTLLIKSGLVRPILLGERDGQCYFLSFWI